MVRKAKGLKTQEKIIRSAIHCLASLGYDKTTFQTIADHCGISQPLVVHYFRKKENVFPTVVDYLVQKTREVVAEAGGGGGTDEQKRPSERLKEYLELTIKSLRADPDTAKIFLTLTFLSAFDRNYRQSNAQIKQTSVNQLIDILAAGVKEREFEITEITLTARMINAYLMGVLTDMLTDDHHPKDEALIKVLCKTVFDLVRYSGDR